MASDSAAAALLFCLCATGLGWTAAAVTSSSVTSGGATVSGSVSGAASVSGGPKRPAEKAAPAGGEVRSKTTKTGSGPVPSVTRLVQEYAIPNGQAVKTTQIITGKGISGVTETLQITQTKAKQFSSTSTTKIGKAPAVTTVTSNTPEGTKVKLTLGEGKQELELNALPPFDFDVKSLTSDFFKEGKEELKESPENLFNINEKIQAVKKKVDSVFKTGFFAAEDEYWDKIAGISTRFEQTSKKFKELGLKYPEFKLEF